MILAGHATNRAGSSGTIRRILHVNTGAAIVCAFAADVWRFVARLCTARGVDEKGPWNLARYATDHHLGLVVKVDAKHRQDHPPLKVVGVRVATATPGVSARAAVGTFASAHLSAASFRMIGRS
jgi:hypothetical protein